MCMPKNLLKRVPSLKVEPIAVGKNSLAPGIAVLRSKTHRCASHVCARIAGGGHRRRNETLGRMQNCSHRQESQRGDKQGLAMTRDQCPDSGGVSGTRSR